MAIESTTLVDILNKEGDATAKAEEIISIFGEDTKAQLNAVLMNKETILSEKRDSEAKRKALEEQMANLKAANEKLSKQLDASSPEEVKKVYDQQLTELSNVHEKKVAELNTVLETYKTRVSELERSHLKLACMEEFNKEIEGKNIAPDVLQDFATFILGEDCNKFGFRPIGNDKSVLATKDGTTIKQAIEAGLHTTFGKRCVISTSSGGGAEGASWNMSGISNPFKTGNITEQLKLAKSNPELYKTLKAQALS